MRERGLTFASAVIVWKSEECCPMIGTGFHAMVARTDRCAARNAAG